ncbi:hypothetical protein Tco_0395069, partial [Tanacetum coccineum]
DWRTTRALEERSTVFSSDTSFSNFATLSSTEESASNSGIANVMVRASVMIGYMGIGVGVCCTDEMIDVT